MSLNGLDDVRVKEAHDAAIAEAGGWFLLKYASRDEIELLGRGTGGIVEIRNEIAQYEEKSPLYGFLRYRRRNVIIKYLPDDCSRLVQARVTVHFNAVCDRFAPHDTIFEITEAKELKDTKLSAACSLHAASGSTSSSTSSLRRRRLVEITEEEEEEERERKRQSTVKEEDHRPCTPQGTPISPVKLNADLANSPEASRFSNNLEPPHFTGVEGPSSPTQSLDEAARRISSQSSRADFYSTYPFLKPRVKLGPRPAASTESVGRPGTAEGGTSRPVASIPAKVKALSKGTKKGRSTEEEEGTEEVENTTPEVTVSTPTDPATDSADKEVERPTTSSGVSPLFGIEVPAIAAPPTKQNTMTPEKARLLKAMKLREKKKMMSLRPSALELPNGDIPSALSSPGLPEDAHDIETQSIAQPDEEIAPESNDQEGLVTISKAESNTDSGIGIEVHADQSSIDVQTDSHPTSPLASSDISGSTQASSLSDSTEETILAKDGNDDHENHSAIQPSPTNAQQQPADSGPLTASAPTVEAIPHGDDNDATISSSGEATLQALPVSRFSVASVPAKVPERSPTPVEPDTKPAVEDATQSSPVHIPLSKFSTKDSKSPTSADDEVASTAVAKEDVPATTELPAVVVAANPGDNAETRPAEEAPTTKRKTGIEHIRTDLEVSDVDKRQSVISITDNDGFMEELRSATVQEATPITVSKSPISSIFPSDSTSKRSTVIGTETGAGASGRFTRTVSSPVRTTSLLTPKDMPPPSTARSASSGSYMQRVSQVPDSRPQSASRVGSSISQRIQALQKLSGNTSTVTADIPKARPASTFFAVRKPAGRELSRSPSVADRASSLASAPSPSPPGSTESSPDAVRLPRRDRSGSVVNRLSMFEGGMPPRGRPDSIQVTARIVRDPNQPYPHLPEPNADATEYGRLELKQSPLMVDLQNRVSQSPARSASSLSHRGPHDQEGLERRSSLLHRRVSSRGRRSESVERNAELAVEELKKVQEGLRPRRRSSLTVVKDFIKGAKSPSTDNLATSPAQAGVASPGSSRPPSAHNNGLGRRTSVSSRRSSVDHNINTGDVLSPIRTDIGGGADSETESRGDRTPISPNTKASRASRFIRRISNTLTPSSRKAGTPAISPTVAEENAAEVEAASKAQASPSIIAFMGDVNVQFPDNLLWKRRSICLDSLGFLILSAVSGTAMMPSAAKNKQAAMMKRYHITEFKAPYTPDVELQELPNSVVLDFVGGSGLQIACEDRAGQMNILHILLEAHQSHSR
ncbi:hypothetical protein QBC38DRAFT_507170 [Podospora fimiseda]|uniref:ADF-H domain-containing protein n=1 Tax=Podospora fimiseda TaxID=252190 RepID=A0AAN7BWU2_9PEZI|nr:hypothetical protein QBC38DRAFT_507170 [Podospora fimiseda]